MTPEQYLKIWRRALEEEFGVVMELEDKDDRDIIRGEMYKARQESGEEALKALAICVPGDAPNELMVVKRSVELED